MTFINNFSWCCSIHLLKQKSEVLEKFKEFESVMTNEYDQSISTLRTGNGEEYLSSGFQEFLEEKEIRHKVIILHTPERNGVTERMNCTLIKSARAMIAHA